MNLKHPVEWKISVKISKQESQPNNAQYVMKAKTRRATASNVQVSEKLLEYVGTLMRSSTKQFQATWQEH